MHPDLSNQAHRFSTPHPELNRLLQATADLTAAGAPPEAGPRFLEALAPVLARLDASPGPAAALGLEAFFASLPCDGPGPGLPPPGKDCPATAAIGRALRQALISHDRPWRRREVAPFLARVDSHLAHAPNLVKTDLDWGRAFLTAWLEDTRPTPPMQALFQQVVDTASQALERPGLMAA